MSTNPLTQEEADRQVDDLLDLWSRTNSRERSDVEAQINAIIQLCSPGVQNHAWIVTHPGASR